MRYMTPAEIAAGASEASAVYPWCWELKKQEFEADGDLAKEELIRSLGQMLYLRNLAKAGVYSCDIFVFVLHNLFFGLSLQAQEQDSESVGSCPVCTHQLGRETSQVRNIY